MQQANQEEKPVYEKTGNMQGTIGVIIAMVTGIGVAVLVMIFVGALGGQAYQMTETDINALASYAKNDTVTVLFGTPVALAHDDIYSAASVTVLNGTNSVSYSKFMFDLDAGTVNLTDTNFNNTALNFSYPYGQVAAQDSIKRGIISGFEALEQTGGYLPIIVLAVVIALVLALVLGMASNTGGGGNNSAL